MIAGCYVAWNEAALIGESIRSIKAYVDRFVVVDCAFSSNPTPGDVASSDGMREVVEAAAAGKPLTYIVPPGRLEEQDARNRYLAELELDEWALLLDADEILVGDHATIRALLDDGLHKIWPAGGLRIFTAAVMFNGNADAMPEAVYGSAPIITTSGWQPRIVQKRPGLRYQRDELPGGRFTHGVLWLDSYRLVGHELGEPFLLNRHVSQSFAGYQADYAWETAQRDGAR